MAGRITTRFLRYCKVPGAVNTGGTTRLRLYFNLDDNDDSNKELMGYYSGNNNTSANHPQLLITCVE